VLVTHSFRSGDLDKATFDYIVIGAGAAGCALAAGLTDTASCTVLLIEAGRYYGRIDQYPALLQRMDQYSFSLAPGQTYPAKPRYSMFTWSYQGQLNEFLQARIVRGRVVGGSSAVNGGEFTRGRPHDYDTWAGMGNPEWSFENVLPAFRAIETDLDFGESECHGARGPIRVQRGSRDNLGHHSESFLEAATSAGFRWDPDLNGRSTGGVGLIPLNAIEGVRQNAGAAFIDRVVARQNLSLLDQTTVHRILIENGEATGVEVDDHGAARRLYANEIVLCASGINSPHLLMLSGVGSAGRLADVGIRPVCDLGPVGMNLADHPYVLFPFTIPDRSGDGRPSGGLALNYSSGSDSEEDLRIIPNIPLQRSREPGEPWTLGFYCGLSAPRSRGQIVLRSASHRQLPTVQYNYLAALEDRRRMRECVRLAVELLEHPAYRRAGARQIALSEDEVRNDATLDRWIATHLYTAYHSAGTCKMGPPADDTAVVDQYCRVRGIRGLRVVDVSVAPMLMSRGMHATAVMIGERAVSLFRSPNPTARPTLTG
jgi:predicted dehydrogenase (TIGR03970 family)